MSFRNAMWKNLLLAALTLGWTFEARAQAAGPQQQILFTAPDGETASNAPVPAAQAPRPQELPGLSDSSAASTFIPPASPAPPLQWVPTYIPREKSDGLLDDPETLKVKTAAQIMGVPTMEQIFGLPRRQNVTGQGDWTAQGNIQGFQNATQKTNSLFSGTAPSTQPVLNDADWAQLFSTSTPTNGNNSGQSTGAGIFSGLSSQPASSRSFFGDNGNSDQSSDGNLFGSPQPSQTAQSPSWGVLDLNSPSVPSLTQNAPSAKPASPGLDSQSPFSVPESATVAMLPQLPQLPKLPTVPGQNRYSTTAPTAPPSWSPKPPPWVSSQPALGTMEPRKF